MIKQGFSSHHVHFLFQNYYEKQKILGEKQILHIAVFTFIYFCTEELTLILSTELKTITIN